MMPEKIFMIRALLGFGGVLFFLILEALAPYRPNTVSKVKRWKTNITLSVFNSAAISLLFAGQTIKISQDVTARQAGLLNMAGMPGWLKILATVIFMDLILYIWHFLNHKVPFLWRFHNVHHTDLNMDVSTAMRFHIGELSIFAVIKMPLLLFLGADVMGVVVFESLLLLAAQFHHSSLKAPGWFEKIFWVLFVPPSMHRIHHSVVIKERDTNFGTIFSFWDRMLGTFLDGVDQNKIRIGVGAYQNPDRLKLHNLLIMPFAHSDK